MLRSRGQGAGLRNRGMKHDKKQQQLRKKIWKMPFLVDELFKDEDWQKFDSSSSNETIPSDRMKIVIQTVMREQEEQLDRRALRKHRIGRLLRYVSAAAVFLFFSFHFITWWTQDEQMMSIRESSVPARRVAVKDTSWTLIENTSQQTMLVDLPDGSRVKLFRKSHIRYIKNFTVNKRDIQLVGRAYFDVAADPRRPFSVIAIGTKTTALGTSFTINTSFKNNAVQVALHSGKILISSVTNRFKRVFLNSPGQQLTIDNVGGTTLSVESKRPAMKKDHLPVPNADLLVLKNTPMPAVLRALEKAFNHKINIGDKGIAEIHYTGQVDVQKEELKDILTTICLINELRYVVNADGSYTLYKQKNTITENLNN